MHACYTTYRVSFRLDGSTLMADRHRMINQFGTDPNVSLFLLSTKAGGVGLNLTAADTVILMDQVNSKEIITLMRTTVDVLISSGLESAQ